MLSNMKEGICLLSNIDRRIEKSEPYDDLL